MILVGYLVEAAPQVLIWWGGFFYICKDEESILKRIYL